MHRSARLACLAVLLTAVAVSPSGGATRAEARWVITDLGTEGDYLSGGPAAINERGQVVGAGDATRGVRAFLWENGKLRDLGTLGGRESGAVSVNEAGQIIGWSDTRRKDVRRAFLWHDGRMRDLGTLGGAGSEAMAINDRGQIVGSSRTGGTDPGVYGPTPVEHAFLWENGRMRDLGTLGGRRSVALDVNEGGQVVGWSTVQSRHKNGEAIKHAFLWETGRMRDLGVLRGRKESRAIAINDAGQVLAYSYTTDFDLSTTSGHNIDVTTAFVWWNGSRTGLGRGTFPRALSERGEIVGEIYPGGKQWRDDPGTGLDALAFSWANGELRSLLVRETGWTQAVNELGQIVGLQYRDGMQACLWQKDGTLVLLPKHRGDHDGKAVGINERNQIVGISGSSAVIWTLNRG